MTEEERKQRKRMEMEEEYQERSVMLLIFGVPFFLAMDVWVLDRPLRTSFLYSFLLALGVIIVFGSIILFAERSHDDKKRNVLNIVRESRFGMMQIVGMGFCYYTVGAAIRNLYLYLVSPDSGQVPTVLATTACTLAAGTILFVFRLKKRLLYGITEVMVGIAVASYRVTSNVNNGYLHPEFYLAVLTAGVYLVVRGMDNVHQALKSSEAGAAKSRPQIEDVKTDAAPSEGNHRAP